MYLILSILLFSLLIATSNSFQWDIKQPYGASPPQLSKPNCVAVTSFQIVCFNGVKDDCSTQTNNWYDNRYVYIYNTLLNTGKYVQTFGSIPPSAAFASAWKSGYGKVMTAGGIGDYTFTYGNLANRNYSTLFELNIITRRWNAYSSKGDIPSPRGEVSTLVDPDDSSTIYLFGGVSATPSGFHSHAELFRFNIYDRKFELLGISNTSRYHAHIFKTSSNELEISQGVGRTTIEDNVELSDTMRFNFQTKEFRTIYPDPALPYQRRHGVSFQQRIGDTLYGCLYSGDVNVEEREPCCGCLFATYTDTQMLCNAFITNNNHGAWERIDRLTTGEQVPSKYPASDIIGNKLYVFSGQDVDMEKGQSFDETVRVFELLK